MQLGDWFLIANTTLCLGAMVSYAIGKQWQFALYWLGAVILNSSIIWMRFTK